MFGSILGMMGSLMSGMGGGQPMLDNSAAQWQAAQLDASTNMATNANNRAQAAAEQAQGANAQSADMQANALNGIIETFRNSILKNYNNNSGNFQF